MGDNPSFELTDKEDGGEVIKNPEDFNENGELVLHELPAEELNGCMRFIEQLQGALSRFYNEYSSVVHGVIGAIAAVALHVFLGFAMAYDFQKSLPLLVIIICAWVLILYSYVLKPLFARELYFRCFLPLQGVAMNVLEYKFTSWILYLATTVVIIVFLVIDTSDDRSRLVSLGGLFFYIVLLFVFSKNPAKVRFRPVFWGLLLQFMLGLLVLRWPTGSDAFEKAANQIVRFLDYTNNGTDFVYGFLSSPPNICGMGSGIFFFTSLQVIIYFGSIVAVLYYLGIMQLVLKKLAWLMQLTMDTTACESLNAAACIFLGQSEAPLLIRPYLERMTASELHAVMTSGFACIAGSLFAAYISLGACPPYLLSATVMSAPAALAVSKLFYPETETSQVKRIEDLELPKGEEKNAIEAISNGAVMAIEIVAAVAANLIVFLALLAFVNNVVGWFGEMVGYEGLSFEQILGYLFFPLAYVMGASNLADPVERNRETLRVAELMGTKTFLNEFIAFQKLSNIIRDGELSPRAQMIATYALCGFSNLGSIGIQLGVLGSLCPKKKAVFSVIAIRALIAGSVACFMTACIAGVLIDVPISCPPVSANANCFNP